jgi:hypothetical protein
MALAADHISVLIDWRVAELRLLAARTAVEYRRTRPTLADRYFPNLLRLSTGVERVRRSCQSQKFAA